jgi:hypothetical protein
MSALARRDKYHRLELRPVAGRSGPAPLACPRGGLADRCVHSLATQRRDKCQDTGFEICMVSANIPTGLSCAELFYGSHWGLLGHAAGGCEWGTTHSAPSGVSLAAFDCRVSHRHPCVTTWVDGQSGRTPSGKDRCVHSLATQHRDQCQDTASRFLRQCQDNTDGLDCGELF